MSSEAEATRETTAETLDSIAWDYDPASELRSLLTSTEEFFESFPWDGPPTAGTAR